MFERYDIPKSLKSATRHLPLSHSYPVAYHSTNCTNISLRKLLSNTATKDELTVVLSKELLEFSNKNKLYTVSWQNKAETSHRDGMYTISVEVNKKLILVVGASQNGTTECIYI